MLKTSQVTRPDLSSRPLCAVCERMMAQSPRVLYESWTTHRISEWFAAPGTVLMKPDVDTPYFFETHFDDQRHPHYGRFLRLERDRLVEMTWLTAAGTRGVEMVVRVELTPGDDGTRLRLSHRGFPDEASRQGHADAWPEALANLAKVLDVVP